MKSEVVSFLKEVIFELLTSDLDWRSYGVSSNDFQDKYGSLDNYIDKIADRIVEDIPKTPPETVDIGLYIPCISTLHGDYYDDFNDRFRKVLNLPDIIY